MNAALARLVPFALALGCIVGCSEEGVADVPHIPSWPEQLAAGGFTYERNPDVKLAREYWYMVVNADGTRGMFPRPDGNTYVVEECTSGGPLADMFRSAELCEYAPSPEAVDRVNHLDATVARRTSTFLHSKLDFADERRFDHAPHAWDIADVCRRYPEDRTGVLRGPCDYLNWTIEHPPYTPEASRLLVLRVNTIYGIRPR